MPRRRTTEHTGMRQPRWCVSSPSIAPTGGRPAPARHSRGRCLLVAAPGHAAALLLFAAVATLASITSIAVSARAAQAATPGVLCGDANNDDQIKSGDALLALRAAVGSAGCSLAVCDFTGNGNIGASDALAILRKAVGQVVQANCPEPEPPLSWDEGNWGEVSWD